MHAHACALHVRARVQVTPARHSATLSGSSLTHVQSTAAPAAAALDAGGHAGAAVAAAAVSRSAQGGQDIKRSFLAVCRSPCAAPLAFEMMRKLVFVCTYAFATGFRIAVVAMVREHFGAGAPPGPWQHHDLRPLAVEMALVTNACVTHDTRRAMAMCGFTVTRCSTDAWGDFGPATHVLASLQVHDPVSCTVQTVLFDADAEVDAPCLADAVTTAALQAREKIVELLFADAGEEHQGDLVALKCKLWQRHPGHADYVRDALRDPVVTEGNPLALNLSFTLRRRADVCVGPDVVVLPAGDVRPASLLEGTVGLADLTLPHLCGPAFEALTQPHRAVLLALMRKLLAEAVHL